MAVIEVCGLRTCDSTRAAMAVLRARGAVLRDLREQPVAPEVLADWLERLGPGLVNRASATWRGLGEAERAEPPLALLARHPTLIKRPVIVGEGRLTMGWTEAVAAAWASG